MINKSIDSDDTIAAICTGSNSTITVIRISGKKSKEICNKIFYPVNKSQNPINDPKKLILGNLFKYKNNDFGETAFAIYIPAPKTYTGENILEIHAHGGNYNSVRILNKILEYGVRLANPGEFTYRAFINGKIDLTQAEAIADLISSSNISSSRLAEIQMSGKLSKLIIIIRNNFIEILANLEAIINFPEENIKNIDLNNTLNMISTHNKKLKEMYNTKDIKMLLENGMKISIVGPSNTGKSTLLNTLLGINRSITSNIPGTTRDTIEEYFNINDAITMIKLVDTAGIRITNQKIEKIGIKRSIKAIKESQIILCLLDSSEKINILKENIKNITNILLKYKKDKSIIFLWNKIDLIINNKLPNIEHYQTLKISAKKNIGIKKLIDAITKELNSKLPNVESGLIVSLRHAKLIEKILKIISKIIINLKNNELELVIIDLQSVIKLLGNIVGISKELDIYDTIFSKFCIGK